MPGVLPFLEAGQCEPIACADDILVRLFQGEEIDLPINGSSPDHRSYWVTVSYGIAESLQVQR